MYIVVAIFRLKIIIGSIITLKLATAMFPETSEQLQHATPLKLSSRGYTLDTGRENLISRRLRLVLKQFVCSHAY
jgi:hypothetical protein